MNKRKNKIHLPFPRRTNQPKGLLSLRPSPMPWNGTFRWSCGTRRVLAATEKGAQVGKFRKSTTYCGQDTGGIFPAKFPLSPHELAAKRAAFIALLAAE